MIESQGVGGGEAVLADGAATPGTSGTLDFSTVTPDSIPSELISQHPDFRKLQSTYDRKLAQLEQRLQQTHGQAAQAVSQVQSEYGDRVRSALGDRFDETAQRDLTVWELETRLQTLETERQQMLEQQARQQHLQEISAQYGIDLDALLDVPDPLSAYQLAADKQSQLVKDLQQKLNDLESKLQNAGNAQAHIPDVGGGVSVTTSSATQNDYNLAAAHGDSKAMDSIQRYAVANDIALDTGAIYQNPALMQKLRETS